MSNNRTENQQDEIKFWFSQNIEKSMGSLYSMAMRLTRNNADAEDLVAEAVAKAWSAVASLEDRDRFRPWIFRILHNCFISHYRKKSVRPEESIYEEEPAENVSCEVAQLLIEQPDEFVSWWANPEREFVNNLLGEQIVQAIEQLPNVFQVTVVLINLEGFSYDEAAEVLGVSPGTIRSRMNRGRTLLQKALWQHAKDAGFINKSPTLECST